MENVEQPAGHASQGGGANMSNNAEQIIETYLTLIQQNLPNCLLDEVIPEIRDYLTESATELGGGELTASSAKRAVARFGAPSEVAEEYKSSMLLKEEPSVTTKEATPPEPQDDLDNDTYVSVMDEDTTRRTVPEAIAFGQYMLLVLIWSVVVLVLSGGFVPTFFISMLPLVAGASLFVVAHFIVSRMNLARFVDADSRKWPLYRRIVSLPRPVPAPDSSTIMKFSIHASVVGGITCFFLSFGVVNFAFYGIPAGFLLLLRAVLVDKEIHTFARKNSARHSLIYDLLCLVLMSWAYLSLLYNVWSGVFVVSLFTILDLVFGGYLLFNISVNSEKIWTEDRPSKPLPQTPEGQALPSSGEEEPGQTEGRAKKTDVLPYFESFGKGVGLMFLWSTTIVIVTTGIAQAMRIYVWPIFLWPMCLPAAAMLFIRIVYLRQKGVVLENTPHPEWSPVQSALSFPENCTLQPKGYFLLTDGVISAGFGMAFIASFLLGGYGVHSRVLSILLSLICLRRLGHIRKRLTGKDPARFAKTEFGLILASIGISNFAFSLILTPTWEGYHMGVNPLLVLYFALSAPYLLYLLVAYGHDLWWEVQEVSLPSKEQEVRISNRESEFRRESKSASEILSAIKFKIVGRYLAFTLVGTWFIPTLAILYFSTVNSWESPDRYAVWRTLSLVMVQGLLWLLVAALTGALYIGVRRAYVRKRPKAAPIGRRTRGEATLDFAFVLFFSLLFTLAFFFNSTGWIDLSDLNIVYVLMVATLPVMLYFRLAGDALNIINGDSPTSSRLIASSSKALLVGVGTLLAWMLYISTYNHYMLHPSYISSWILLYTGLFLFSFQAAVSKYKHLDTQEEGKRNLPDAHGEATLAKEDRETRTPTQLLVDEIDRKRAVTISGMLMPYALFYLLYYSLLVIGFPYPDNELTNITFLVFAFIIIAAISGAVFFKYRTILVRSGESSSALGRRGRVVAVLDVIFSILVLASVVVPVLPCLFFYPSGTIDLLQLLILGGVALTVSGVILRILGDIYYGLERQTVKSDIAMAFGSLILVIAILLFMPGYLLIQHSLIRSHYLIVPYLGFCIPISFQAITSWLRLQDAIASQATTRVSQKPSSLAMTESDATIPVNY